MLGAAKIHVCSVMNTGVIGCLLFAIPVRLPYQKSIDLCLLDCAKKRKKLTMKLVVQCRAPVVGRFPAVKLPAQEDHPSGIISLWKEPAPDRD
jgi:hypothetical protein